MSKFLFIIDPLKELHVETDTTLLLMAEAKRRGHEVWITEIDNLRMYENKPHAVMIQWKDGQNVQGKITDKALEEMNLIFMRKDPPYSLHYIFATSLLSLVDRTKTFIMNDPAALRNFNEKLGIFQFPEYIPETIVSKKYADILLFLHKHKTIVLKPLEGYGGHEIIVLDDKDRNKNALLEMMTQQEKRYLMAQKYIAAVKKGDKRIVILDGDILGQQNRVAAKDDHRSNISAGGSSHKTTLSAREEKIALTVGRTLRQQGIYFAGLDMIGGYITEINITSPTGLVKINEHEGSHLERHVIDFCEAKITNLYA